jgi:oligoendopeptidase F
MTRAPAARSVAELGALPEWDLIDLYAALDSPLLEADLERAWAQAGALAERTRGRLAELDGERLAEVVRAYEQLTDTLGRVMSFAQLVYAADMTDPDSARFLQTVRERVNDIGTEVLFVTLELNRIDDAVLERQLEAQALARYRPWIRDTRVFRDHQLDDELERLLHEKQVAGRAAWVRLFDETIARLRFAFRGEELNCAQALDLLSAKDGEVRREIAGVLERTFGDNIHTFALIANTLAKDKEIEDRWRRYERPISQRNLENMVEDEVVDALLAAVRDAYPRLSHRYYALKAGWLGTEALGGARLLGPQRAAARGRR